MCIWIVTARITTLSVHDNPPFVPIKRSSPVHPPFSDERPRNQLLAALPADDFRRIRRYLTTVPTRVKQVLQKSGEPIQTVYFLNGGVASITTVLLDGTIVEAATVGDEGMLGTDAFFGADAVAPGETLIQVPDTNAEVMSVKDFRQEVGSAGAFQDIIGRYVQVFVAQMMQTTACNAVHQVPQRCARWLLMTHDRMHEQDFRLSQEFLAVMWVSSVPPSVPLPPRCKKPD
jgi:CRP-like cAMP-binding protein